MSDEQRRRPGIGEGLRAGIGILTAFKEAIEETIQEAVDRGEMKPERAKEAVQGAMRRAQGAIEDVRDRLDVVPRTDFDDLRARVDALSARVRVLEEGGRGDEPDASGILAGPP